MNNPNLPDDCQSLTDRNLPWNCPEICEDCNSYEDECTCEDDE